MKFWTMTEYHAFLDEMCVILFHRGYFWLIRKTMTQPSGKGCAQIECMTLREERMQGCAQYNVCKTHAGHIGYALMMHMTPQCEVST